MQNVKGRCSDSNLLFSLSIGHSAGAKSSEVGGKVKAEEESNRETIVGSSRETLRPWGMDIGFFK